MADAGHTGLTSLRAVLFDVDFTLCRPGPELSAQSYARIAETMRLPAGAILFVSDVVPELDAAAAAGMRTTLSIRPGNAAQPRDHGHPTVSGFDEIP